MSDVTLEALVTVGGISVICAILVQVLKENLKDWRGINWLAIVIGMILALAARTALGWNAWGELLTAAVNGFLGAALATLGYETIVNTIGKVLNRGPRSNESLLANATKLVKDDKDANIP